MKSIYLYIAFLFVGCATVNVPISTPQLNQKSVDNQSGEMLIGHCSRNCLLVSPYKEWYLKNYDDYKVDSITADIFRNQLKDKSIVIFMGTWCGDSRREVPRLLKILDYCKIPDDQVKMVMMDYREGAYKQSPQHEERGMQIFRVPSFLIYSGDQEKGRIIESPKESLEKDIQKILSGESYVPNYPAGSWLMKELATNPAPRLIKDTARLVAKLKPWLRNQSELNSIALVSLDAKEFEKAVLLYQISTILFPTSISGWNGLGRALISNGKKQLAKAPLQQANSIDPKNTETIKLMTLTE